jgi:succinyl-CoA synthetase beta subunit
MVVRIVGTNADLAARILAEAGDPDIQTASTLDDAVAKVVAVAGPSSSGAGAAS